MSKYKSLIDRIDIPSPCNADWESMIGNDQVRFCEHCSLTVHDISTMTRRRAEQLVAKSEGRLCVRYHRIADGPIITAGSPGKLHQITRKVSRVAAGAFTVALTMSSAVVAKQSQNKPTTTSSAGKQEQNKPIE